MGMELGWRRRGKGRARSGCAYIGVLGNGIMLESRYSAPMCIRIDKDVTVKYSIMRDCNYYDPKFVLHDWSHSLVSPDLACVRDYPSLCDILSDPTQY
jgi:hypothetical protein